MALQLSLPLVSAVPMAVQQQAVPRTGSFGEMHQYTQVSLAQVPSQVLLTDRADGIQPPLTHRADGMQPMQGNQSQYGPSF